MCGIIAVIGKYRYERIPDSLKDRGVDSSGIYEDKDVQLIQTRLQITGNDVFNLPVETERYVILFNGEIYNYKEINEELSEFNFKYDSDFETALYAYIKWGDDFVNRINGQFAIIIWDKETKEHHVFVDEYRIKTLYRKEYNDSIIYSSNISSLPFVEFKEIKITGYGNVSDTEIL